MPAPDQAVQLSPFEVRSEGRGYLASHTLAGTRLNSRLEDLGASITVVTREQMSDFALLDVNDIFLYEAGTEGTGTYTEFAFDRNGAPLDTTQLDPNNANRVRGVGAANTAFGNFETSGRVPIDPINIDAVEISRGPNATLFGLGNAAGTVNVQPATAHLERPRSQVAFRTDSYGGWRSSLDLNRVLVPGRLAVRGSAVLQREAFDRKPSGTDSVRLNGMLRYRPFRGTTLELNVSDYRVAGNRPNTTMPRDAVSAWLAAGRPTWNPLTSRVTLNGVPSAQTYGIAALPPYLQNINGTGRTNSTLFVDGDGRILHWGPTQATTTTNPADRNQAVFLVNTFPENLRAGQPLFAAPPAVEDRALYDWTRRNFAAGHRLRERA
ncbi:MAG: TonB-dependent receptor plug domain-containing protein, partial [Verrucomicrobiota bacterium]